MNERIRKLIEEVVRVEIDPDSNMETIYTCGPEDFEAFAELIVLECIRLCDQVDLVGADDCMDKIRDYFGVEE